MDTVLFLRQAGLFESMELERVETVRGLQSSSQSRLWYTRGNCASRQEVTAFWLSLSVRLSQLVFINLLIVQATDVEDYSLANAIVLETELYGVDWQRPDHP